MLIELNYSGHYPRKIVEVTNEEYQKIQKIESNGVYLFDTPEGIEMIDELEKRPAIKQNIPKVVVYA